MGGGGGERENEHRGPPKKSRFTGEIVFLKGKNIPELIAPECGFEFSSSFFRHIFV